MSTAARLDIGALRDYEPLSGLAAAQLRELEAALAIAQSVEDLPGKWQAALLEAEARRAGGTAPTRGAGGHCCGHH